MDNVNEKDRALAQTIRSECFVDVSQTERPCFEWDVDTAASAIAKYRIESIATLNAQRDRALEAVEKLRAALILARPNLPSIDALPVRTRIEAGNAAKAVDEALAATEPATVELPKCDHCGAIACCTDCDGSSHYMTENFRRFEKRSGVTTDVDK